MDKVIELKEANKTEELYQYLLITLCNHLNTILPGMFQRIDDYTELLFPEHLLREGSVLEPGSEPESTDGLRREGKSIPWCRAVV